MHHNCFILFFLYPGKQRRVNMDFPCAETIMNLMKNKPAKKRVGIMSKGAPARGKGNLMKNKPDKKRVGIMSKGAPAKGKGNLMKNKPAKGGNHV